MRPMTIILAAALVAAPAPVFAQEVQEDSTVGTQRDDDDEGNPRLGLLGLIGLAGLLGLMRREPDIHVDARRDKSS